MDVREFQSQPLLRTQFISTATNMVLCDTVFTAPLRVNTQLHPDTPRGYRIEIVHVPTPEVTRGE